MAWIPDLGSVRNRPINYNFQPGITENYINPLVSAMQARQMMELSAERKRQQQLEDIKRQQLQGIGEQYGTTPDLKKLGASLISSGEVGAGLSAITQDRLERKESITDPKIAKFNKDLASVMMPLKDDPIAWEKARMELDSTNSFIPAFDDASKQGWLNFAQMKDDAKPQSVSDLFQIANSKIAVPKEYERWYNTLSQEEKNVVSNPNEYNTQQLEKMYSKGTLEAKTLENKLAQSSLEGKEAKAQASAYNMNALFADKEGKPIVEVYESIPKHLEARFDKISAKYDKRAEESQQSILKTREIMGLLSEGGKVLEGAQGYRALAAAFGFMKALDPRSIVRESEQAQVTGEGGVWDRILNYSSKLEKNTNFTAEQVKDMYDTVEKMMNLSTQSLQYVNLDAAENLMDFKLDPRLYLSGSAYGSIQDQLVGRAMAKRDITGGFRQ